MDSDENPPNLVDDLELSTNLLARIPSKKCLEILFAATIIPNRRQLALKYELSEQEIHNVLSHRQYLLQNWQYNGNTEELLNKRDLENSMAITEILMEWKRRVQLNGLQITDNALIRKAKLLVHILNAQNLKLTEGWWNQFNLNWDYKQFRECDNESLEMEDILHDLKWLFLDGAFRRLVSAFRRYKDIRSGVSVAIAGSENELDSSDIEEFINISFIKADPYYYNDDQFDCEDYELILDEENVVDALRKEIQDQEAEKFKQSVQAGDSPAEELLVQDEDIAEEENVIERVDSEEKLNAMFNESPYPKRREGKEEEQSRMYVAVSKHVAVQPPRRRTRNVNAVMSLRKDQVRLNVSSDITILERNDNPNRLEHNSEDTDDDDDNNTYYDNEECPMKSNFKKLGRKRKMITTSLPKSKTTPKRKYQSRKGKNHTQTIAQSPVFDEVDGFREETQADSDEAIAKTSAHLSDSLVKDETLSSLNSDSQEFLISDEKKLIHNFKRNVAKPHPLPSLERNNNIASINKASNDNRIQNRTTFILDKNIRRSHRISGKSIEKTCIVEMENETILGGSYSYEDERIQSAAIVAAHNVEENDKIFQDLLGENSELDVGKSPSKQRIVKPKANRKPKLVKTANKPLCSPQSNINVIARPVPVFKRGKRRTDASDLTLRKDKVRINLPIIDEKKSVLGNQQAQISEDIQMIYEPYVSDG